MQAESAETVVDLPVYKQATKDLPEGKLVWIEEVANFVNHCPADIRMRRRRQMMTVRPTVLAIVRNPFTHEVLLVQTANAATNQFCPPQGGLRLNETVTASAVRVVQKEGGVSLFESDVTYLGSMLLPVPEKSTKQEGNLTHQLFHVVFVHTNTSAARAGKDMQSAFFAHIKSLPDLMLAPAGPQKQRLLSATFAEVHAQQLLPHNPLATDGSSAVA